MGLKFTDDENLKRARAQPGPGSYNINAGRYADSNMRKEPEYRIGTAKRLGGSLSKNSRAPGPAHYNTIEAASLVKSKSPEFRIGSAKRI
jgi:hypothetical protein